MTNSSTTAVSGPLHHLGGSARTRSNSSGGSASSMPKSGLCGTRPCLPRFVENRLRVAVRRTRLRRLGALALAAHDHWAVFVDVVKPAYPHRSVELGGWPQEFTLIGGIMLLCAAFSSLVAFLGSLAHRKFSKTTPEVSEPVAVASGGAGREPVAGVVVESWVVEERPFG